MKPNKKYRKFLSVKNSEDRHLHLSEMVRSFPSGLCDKEVINSICWEMYFPSSDVLSFVVLVFEINIVL